MCHYSEKLNELSCEIPISIISPVTLSYRRINFQKLTQ